MRKRFFNFMSFLLVASLLLVSQTQVFATSIERATETVLNSETSQEVSVSEIDALIEQRTKALIENNQKLYDEINGSLEERGLSEVTLEEVIELTGSVPMIDGSTLSPDSLDKPEMDALASSATFETVYSTYVTGGRSYDVMRVYATPNGNTGTLYQTGNTSVTNSASAAANTMAFIKIGVSSVAGLASDTIGVVQTVYGALSGIVSQLSTTSTVTNIKATYVWNAAETCVFVYFPSPTIGGLWNVKAIYSKATSGVGVNVPTLVTSANGTIAVVQQKSYSGSATPVNYNSTAKAFESYQNGGTYQSRVSKITITGIEGKTVKTINLRNPSIPAEIS